MVFLPPGRIFFFLRPLPLALSPPSLAISLFSLPLPSHPFLPIGAFSSSYPLNKCLSPCPHFFLSPCLTFTLPHFNSLFFSAYFPNVPFYFYVYPCLPFIHFSHFFPFTPPSVIFSPSYQCLFLICFYVCALFTNRRYSPVFQLELSLPQSDSRAPCIRRLSRTAADSLLPG